VVVRRSRESRILDAASELLLVFGYRRVTIDDVARRAGVGKGTVYLHWASKLELFATVLIRDAAAIVVSRRSG
jgi:AcrR family transcriptional regulator